MSLIPEFSRTFSIAVVLLLLVWPASAQEDLFNLAGTEDRDLLDEFAFLEESAVVESAARHKQEIGMSPSAITLITREDIETSGASTITELLRVVPGMDVVLTTPFASGITSRLEWTYENNHYLVLVDGREANIEVLGLTPFEIQPVSLDDIERIEIIRGPGSSLYGANALAGVVSITTRAMPQKSSAFVRLAGGEVGLSQLDLRASTRIGDWGLSASGGVESMTGFAKRSDRGRDVRKFRSLVDYRLSDSDRLLMDLGLSDGSGRMASGVGDIDTTAALHSLRLAYESESLRGQLYWSHAGIRVALDSLLDFAGSRLAEFVPADVAAHTVDGEAQYTLPRLWSPLLVIVGGGARATYVGSDQLLDGDAYSDASNPEYHRPGIDHWEARASAFVHGELSPADWMTATFGLRFDYNTVTEAFLSPRLAAVFRPAAGHFLRLGVARAFRKPAFTETDAHVMVRFPDESPLTGGDRDAFLEFMSRVLGNPDLHTNEQLISFELGYLGEFLDGRLNLGADIYYNWYGDRVALRSDIQLDQNGFPDVTASSLMFKNVGEPIQIIGGELSVRFRPSRNVFLLASWTHREVKNLDSKITQDTSPKNLITVGGRFRTESGLLGSLYAFSRSEFWDRKISNPEGIMQPFLRQHLDDAVLLIGKLGWQLPARNDLNMEAGIKLFLPFSPFSSPRFRTYDRGGGVTISGRSYGGEELCRLLAAYLQGSF